MTSQERKIIPLILLISLSLGARSQPIELIRNSEVVEKYDQIQSAINASQSGDVIQVAGGTYHENLIVENLDGTADKPITLTAAQGAEVILDIADPELQKPGNDRWTKTGDNKYEATVPWLGDDWRALNSWVSREDETLLAAYAWEEKLDQQIRGSGTLRGDGEFQPANQVKIKLREGEDPNQISLNVPVAAFGIEFKNSSYWNIENITIQHAGFAAVFFSDKESHHNTINRVNVYSSHRAFSTDEYNKAPDYLTFKNCYIKNDISADRAWDWREGYSDDRDSPGHGLASGNPFNAHAIMIFNSNYTEIAHCEIDGHWDGAMVYGDNTSMHHCIIKNILDDAVELEGHGSENFHFYNNLLYNTWAGISVGSDPVGPMYIYRNMVVATQEFLFYDEWQPGYCVKFGINFNNLITENIKFYHNTFVGKDELIKVWNEDANPELFNEIYFVNNLFHITQDRSGISDLFEPPCDEQNYVNSNLYNNKASLQDIKEVCPEWGTKGIVGHTGLENFESNPPNLTLEQTSDAIDAGSELVKAKGWPDTVENKDEKPDIGAHEYGIIFPPVGVLEYNK